MNLLLWIISEILSSITNSYRKKAIDNTSLKNWSFTIISVFIWLIFVSLFVFFSWEKMAILGNNIAIAIVLIVSIVQILTNYIYIDVYKKVKISNLLPFENVWSLLIILIWFFIFYWSENQTSITTFIITLITIFVIIWFNFNWSKIKISKYIKLYIFALTLDAWVILSLWFLLLNYSSLNYMMLTIFMDFILYFLLILITKESIKLIFKQKKVFYQARLISIILGRTWFFIWLYIIETSWVLIATLISFLWIVFSILSMKFILWDNPTNKQIILAYIVSILISIWYYFK